MDNFEKKLKNNLENYEIKTTANDILASFENEKETNSKYHFFNTKLFKIAFPLSLSLSSLVIAFSVYNLINGSSKREFNLDASDASILKTEVDLLNYSVDYDSPNAMDIDATNLSLNDLSTTSIQVSSGNKNGYQNVVNHFDIVAPTYYYLDNNLSSNLSTKDYVKDVSYTDNGNQYHKKSEYYFKNNKLFDLYYQVNRKNNNDKEWDLSAVIVKNNSKLSLTSTKTIDENNNYIIETCLTANNYRYSAKRSVDADKESDYSFIKYSTKSNKTFSASIKQDLINNVSYLSTTGKTTYSFVSKRTSLNNYQIVSGDYSFSLVFNQKNRQYTSNDYGEITK